ncbi:hypothetical protein GPALN_012796 [Globodera pallida]|nr:hypothetical protein GPALN_012796 [Globodera pallida]
MTDQFASKLNMNRKEVDKALLTLTIVSLTIALFVLAVIVCSTRIRSLKKARDRSRTHRHSQKNGPEMNELEWIDATKSDLISSTIKVNSLHTSN